MFSNQRRREFFDDWKPLVITFGGSEQCRTRGALCVDSRSAYCRVEVGEAFFEKFAHGGALAVAVA